ncbi:MAG TPA: class I tRNA ligase family protein, partial [Anaerolineales bacterium]|nr:class I tRNA ligase family protein [Anaerolineales bacterium]
PLVLMDEFGTDALRFTMLVGSTPGNDTNVGPKKVESNRNFANKIWNAGRFVISAIDSLSEDGQQTIDHNGRDWTLADSWIWAKLQQLVRDVDRQFQNFQYGLAGQQIYEFIWNDFADWYVEIAKEQMKNSDTRSTTVKTLVQVFETSLRLLHPFTPFVTEEVWGYLHTALRDSALKDLCKDWPNALIVAKFPEPREAESWEESRIVEFALIQELVRSIRNLRAEKNVAPSKKLAAQFAAAEKTNLLKEQSSVIAALAGLNPDETSIEKSITKKPSASAAIVAGSVEIYIPLAGLVDVANDKARLEKELKEAESHIQRLENLLGGDFANKAPAALVQKEREKLAAYKDTAARIKTQLK